MSPAIPYLLFNLNLRLPECCLVNLSVSVCITNKGLCFLQKALLGKNGILYRNLKQSFPRDEVTDPQLVPWDPDNKLGLLAMTV